MVDRRYEVPTLIVSSTDKKLKQYPKLETKIAHKDLKQFKTTITKYKILNSILVTEINTLKKMGFTGELEWKVMTDENSNLSTATSKALKILF